MNTSTWRPLSLPSSHAPFSSTSGLPVSRRCCSPRRLLRLPSAAPICPGSRLWMCPRGDIIPSLTWAPGLAFCFCFCFRFCLCFCFFALLSWLPSQLYFVSNHFVPGSHELQKLGGFSLSEVSMPQAGTAPKPTCPSEEAVNPTATARLSDSLMQSQHSKDWRDVEPGHVNRFNMKSSHGGGNGLTTESHPLLAAHPAQNRKTHFIIQAHHEHLTAVIPAGLTSASWSLALLQNIPFKPHAMARL